MFSKEEFDKMIDDQFENSSIDGKHKMLEAMLEKC